MPEIVEWFHPKRRTGQTRLLMVGAVVGALVVLMSSTLFSWPVGGGSAAAANDPNAAFDAPDGSCLVWPAGTTDISQVDCSAKHLFEIAGTVDLTSRYPSGAPFPDGTLWQKISQDNCGPVATKYMSGKLDPNGKYSVNALNPTAQQWSDGARTIRCGLQFAGHGGALQLTTGSARTSDQSPIYPVGTCLGIKDKDVSDPVACTAPHSYEIVGIVDLKSQFPDGFPAEDKQQTALSTRCVQANADYTGGLDLSKFKLGLTWDTVKQESWDLGSTKVNCKVGKKLDDGSGLDTVTNSVKGVGGNGASATTTSAPPAGG
ncbi:septum formation family protein [Kutzneria sp. NPDC052558]|uniref:septum formation family protein n=1 Tax=Kutzneria sp. NPDC052558 TaxID=3364121 RepID=UPI0037C6AFD0